MKKIKKLRNLFVVLSLLLSHAMCAVIAYLYRDMRCGIAHMGCSASAGVVFFYAIPFIIGIGVCVALAIVCHKKAKRAGVAVKSID